MSFASYFIKWESLLRNLVSFYFSILLLSDSTATENVLSTKHQLLGSRRQELENNAQEEVKLIKNGVKYPVSIASIPIKTKARDKQKENPHQLSQFQPKALSEPENHPRYKTESELSGKKAKNVIVESDEKVKINDLRNLMNADATRDAADTSFNHNRADSRKISNDVLVNYDESKSVTPEEHPPSEARDKDTTRKNKATERENSTDRNSPKSSRKVEMGNVDLRNSKAPLRTDDKIANALEKDNLEEDSTNVPLFIDDFDDVESQKKNKFMETINPRILSIFVTEDDDLSQQDIEELTFRIEDVFLEEVKTLSTEEPEHEIIRHEIKKGRVLRQRKSEPILEKFLSTQEQMHFLSQLQEKEVKLRLKFQKCCDCERKKTYRRLLEVR